MHARGRSFDAGVRRRRGDQQHLGLGLERGRKFHRLLGVESGHGQHDEVVSARAGARLRVNAIAPGLVRTRFAGWPESTFERAPAQTPLQRIATAEEVAALVLFLAVDATAITAETILIDGGRTQLGDTRAR